MNKQQLRSEIRQRFKATTADQRSRWSAEVCSRLYGISELQNAKTVMAFSPLSDEVDIMPLLDALHNRGVTIVVPEVVSDTDMQLRLYTPDSATKRGMLGTTVPDTAIFTDYAQIDAVLVPGVAFDQQGHRLGRGKGYYDRFLKMLATGTRKIAVCYPYQLVEHVPTEEHDITMDYV